MGQLTLFDYQQVDTETRTLLKYRADRICERSQRIAQNIWENGKDYYEAQQELAQPGRYSDGMFQAWAESETPYSLRTVYNFISVYRNLNCANFAQIKIAASALYLLAAPSTPDEIRQEFLTRAQQGETVTYSQVKEANGIHKTVTPQVAISGIPEDNQPLFGRDEHLDAALDDQDKPICEQCGQVYDGSFCPDCRPFNYLRDNRRSTTQDIYTPNGMDACQTPAYALDPLLPYLCPDWVIWEPAAGEGLLVEGLYDSGYRESQVVCGDILTGQNFFEYQPDQWDCLVTNPPYSTHAKWLERCYQLGKPFALLMKVEYLGNATETALFKRFGIEVIFVSPRINYKMPNKGWDSGGAQFPTAWFTWGLNIGQQMTFSTCVGRRP